MLIQDIEQVTRDFIKMFSNKEYTGTITVNKLNPIGYEVILYQQGTYVPMVFYAELEGNDFIKFLREEIRAKKFHLSQYGQLNKIEPTTCVPTSKACKCNDKR